MEAQCTCGLPARDRSYTTTEQGFATIELMGFILLYCEKCGSIIAAKPAPR